MRVLRSLGALLVLLALLVGVPLLLLTWVGNPWPPGGWPEVQLLSDRTWIGALAVVMWVLWAQLAYCVVVETIAAVSGGVAARVRVAPAPQQDLARLLVRTVLAVGISSAAIAGPATAAAAPGAEPAAPAPAQTQAAAPTHAETDVVEIAVGTDTTSWGLAEQHLGAGERWREIVDLNTGAVMADGTSYTDRGQTIVAGSVFRLPGDAVNLDAHLSSEAERPARRVVVEEGEFLSLIAQREMGDGNQWPRLYQANRDVIGSDPDLIHPGQRLHIPREDPAVVRDGDRPQPTTMPPAGSPRPESAPLTPPSAPAPREDSSADTVAPEQATSPPVAAPHRPGETGATQGMDGMGAEILEDLSGLRALLATAAVLAGGAGLMLAANRRQQWRHRRAGRTIAPAPSREVAATEHAVRDAAAEHLDTTVFIDRALRHLAASQAASGRPLPDLGAVIVDHTELTAAFSTRATGPAPDGWQADETNQAWRLRRDTILDPDLDEHPAPYPALVSVGREPHGDRLWLLDLEAVGNCGLAVADPEPLMRFWVAELALNPWSHHAQILLTTDLEETAALNPARIRPTDTDAALRRARQAVTNPDVLLELRRDGTIADSTGPVVVVVAASQPDPPWDPASRSRVVLIHPTAREAAPLLEQSDDGQITLCGWNTRLEPFSLSAAHAEAMARLLASANQLEDAPMPLADDSTPLGQAATVDGSLRAGLTSDRAPDGDPGSLLPEPDETYLAAAATTTDDLAALAPHVDDEIAADIVALDPSLDADLAAWHDSESDRLKIQVLGPVDVTVPPGRRDAAPTNLGGTIEFLVYLACHDQGIPPERAADQLGWSSGTVMNRARDARTWLGDHGDGEPWLPEAAKSPSALHRGQWTYELHPEALCSADLFRRLRMRAEARGPQGIADLEAALRLVTGQPFDQLRRNGYAWLLEGDRLDHHLTAAIADVGHTVATDALARGDLRRARWVCQVVLKAVPHDERARLDLCAVTQAETGSGEAQARDLLNAEDADPTPRTIGVLDARGWLTHKRN